MAAVERPPQCRPQVVLLGFQNGKPGLLMWPPHGPAGLMGLGKVVKSVAAAGLGRLSAGFQHLQRIGTDRLELTVTNLCLGARFGGDDGPRACSQRATLAEPAARASHFHHFQ